MIHQNIIFFLVFVRKISVSAFLKMFQRPEKYHAQISPNVVNNSGEYVVNKSLNKSQIMIMKSLRNNPNITIEAISRETGLGHTAIQNNLNKLQNINIIKRIGSRKNGYWEILK